MCCCWQSSFFLEDLSGRLVAEEGPPGEGHRPGKVAVAATFATRLGKSTSLFVIHQVGHCVGQLKGVLAIVTL